MKSEEQMSLVIMGTFKGQDNFVLMGLCTKYYCEIVIVPNNLTNIFQPSDITIVAVVKGVEHISTNVLL